MTRIVLSLLLAAFCANATFSQESTPKADVILQLFQWPWNEVARLCTDVLSLRKGIGAVQISSPQPHRIVNRLSGRPEIRRPWWERYQPISLIIGDTRGGTQEEFREMVSICKSNGIEVYSEVVINHLLAADAGLGRSTNWQCLFVDETNQSLSYTSASTIVNLVKMGAAVPDEYSYVSHGMQKFFWHLASNVGLPRVAAFEHHGQLHGRPASNPYASLDVLSPSQRTIATVLLLLSHPDQAGKPRLVWDYETDVGSDWRGSPSFPDFAIKSPLDFHDPSEFHYWRQEYQESWILQVSELRWKWFLERRTSEGYHGVEATTSYEFHPQSSGPADSAVIAYVVPIDVINRPIEGFVNRRCKVGIIIVSVHRNGTVFDGEEQQLIPGSYVLDDFGSAGEVSFLPLTNQRICGPENIVTNYQPAWPESNEECIKLRRTEGTDENPEGKTEIVLPALSGFARPHFVVFEAEILSDWVCYAPED